MIRVWKVLVLNADGSPLQVSPWEKVIHLPLEGLAFVLEWAVGEDGDRVPLHGGGGRVVIDLPSVLQVKQFVKRERRLNFSRHAVYQRDDWKCAYCGDELDAGDSTLDHIIPKKHLSGMESSSWGNCTTCCKSCNTIKGSWSLADLRKMGIRTHNGREFRLLKEPTCPPNVGSGGLVRYVGRKNLEWLHYLQGWRKCCVTMGREWLILAYEERFGLEDSRPPTG